MTHQVIIWLQNGQMPILLHYNVFEEKIVTGLVLAPYLNQPVYVAFCMEYTQPSTAPVGNRWLIDNVQIIQECLNPAVNTLNVAPVLATSATLNWAATAGSVGYQIENVIQFGTFTGNPTGTSVTNSFVQTNLTGTTCYQFKVRNDCGSGNYGSWVGPFSYCTTVVPPVCGGIFTDSGGIAANYTNNENSPVTILPINATDQVTVNFTAFTTQTGSDTLKIYDGNSVATGTLLGTFSGNTNTGSFTGSTASGALIFVFKSDNSIIGAGWRADVTCNPPPACQKPTALISSNVTINSFTAAWTNLGIVDSSQVLVLPCNAPAPTATSTGWTPTTANSLTLNGQASGTCFNIYVRSACPSGLLSVRAGPISVTTLIPPPVCGGNFIDEVGIGGNNTGASPLNCPVNSNYGPIIICPVVPVYKVTVTFTVFNTEVNYDGLYVYNGSGENAANQISSTNGPANVPGGLSGSYLGTTIPGPFTSIIPDGYLTFVFRSDGSEVREGWVSTITCTPQPTCTKPITLQTSLITATSTTLSWSQPVNPNGTTATTWQVIAMPCSTTAPLANNPNWITTTNNPYQFIGLNPDTCYDFYVKAVCSSTDMSVAFIKVSANTFPTCSKPTTLQTSLITSSSITLSWIQPINQNASTATTWQVIAVPCSTTAPLANNPNWLTTTNNLYQFIGLNPDTCYDFYVKAVCSSTYISSLLIKISTNTSIISPSCGDNFYDFGGLTANYPNSANSSTIICPTTLGQIITVTFTAFNIEANWDGLYVFDVNNVNAPQIASNNLAANVPGGLAGSYWGTTIPGPFKSTSPDGCLTFNLRSDGSSNRSGWSANVTCTNGPTCVRPYLLNVTNTTQTTATLGWTQLPNFVEVLQLHGKS